MNKIEPLLFIGCISLLFLAGCAKQQQFKAVEQICAPQMSKPEAMRAAEEVLGKMHFTIEKANAEQGIIRTRPLAGAQFFELWRSDNVGAFNSAEANLHSIRRIVELDIGQQDGQLCIGCEVKTQRLSLPERQMSSWRTYGFKFQVSNFEYRNAAWVDLGRDSQLETEILKRISSMLDTEYRESSIE